MIKKDCDLRLELDGDPPPVVDASDTLSGTVRVEVGEEVPCHGLVLTQRWETHGRGDRDVGQGRQKRLFEGEWQPGETYEYSFEMQLPPGPYTYRGHYVNIDWRLEVTADIPWSLDPSDDQEFILDPGGRDDYVPGEVASAEITEQQPEDHNSRTWLRLLIGLVFLAPGLAVGYFSIASEGSLIGALFGLAFAGGGVLVLYTAVRNYFAEMQLGDVVVESHPTGVSPGEPLECRFAMEPKNDVELERAIVRLQCVEKATYRRGTDSHTYTETVHSDNAVPDASVDARLNPGEPTEFRTDIAIPESGPYTFRASDNRIEWRIVFQLEIPNWPDWSHNRELLVRPPAEQPRSGADDVDTDAPSPPDESDVSSEETDDAYAQTW